MSKILFLDATVRENSRTLKLANHVLSKLSGEVNHVKLCSLSLPILDEKTLSFRNSCCEKQDYSDSLFDNAKQFKEADIVVVAAPFWDYSFPSTLKSYIENICALNLTFAYNDSNQPYSLCKAKKLFYVTTAGGYVDNFDFGFGYIKTVTQSFFGINDHTLFYADGLDIFGNDSNAILESTYKQIDSYFAV